MDRAGIQDALAEAVTEQDEIELIAVFDCKAHIVVEWRISSLDGRKNIWYTEINPWVEIVWDGRKMPC